tara:strand:- start:921 stop:1283 length:363 start_codon:yes stop_codon:yes gene_type:complete
MEFAVITGTVILCLGVFQISKTFEKQKPTKVYMFIDSNGNRVYLEQKTFFDNFKYRQINKNTKLYKAKNDMDKCSISREDIKKGDIIRELKCGHYFKKEYIDLWLFKNSDCPICRKNFIN